MLRQLRYRMRELWELDGLGIASPTQRARQLGGAALAREFPRLAAKYTCAGAHIGLDCI